MIYRLIAPAWITDAPGYNPKEMPRVIEADLDDEQLQALNALGYNCYWLPNSPDAIPEDRPIDGTDIVNWHYVFVDMDLKEGKYPNKESFLEALAEFPLAPTMVVDSGNGVHAYWEITDLQVMDYLRLQRRLARALNTDLAVAKVYQLMRVWGTMNTKTQDNPKPCELVFDSGAKYTAEDLDKALPRITPEDETYCRNHHDKTYNLVPQMKVSDELPAKWFKKFPKGSEGHTLFYGKPKDRSKADYRLAHLMLAADFTKEEAMAVLMQTNKASTRAPQHAYTYAETIVGKVWAHVVEKADTGDQLLSRSVRAILEGDGVDVGDRFPCSELVDATEHGFRLTQVLGLIAGAGAGKTTWAMNLFRWFCEKNPQYIHLFVSLEQPEGEIANRWQRMCGDNPVFYDNVHVLGNYADDGTYRHLSLQDIEDHVKSLERVTGKKVGCVVIDHIGVLKKESRNGEYQGLMDICQYMKAFAKNTNTFLIMQSQTNREKAGIGDIELDKDAAFGTSMFEWFCDYIVTTWQPLKRVYEEAPHMTVTCYKYCKIRHKNTRKDRIKEDTRYALMFDPDTEHLRELTEEEMTAFDYFNKQATNQRNKDRKRDPLSISAINWTAQKKETGNGKPKANPKP